MKIRAGFVSNSSSSSFIISANLKCPTVFALAKQMIRIRGWAADDAHIRKINEIESRGINPNWPIAFPTINFETYICPVVVGPDIYFAVSTSNNHEWYDHLDMVGGPIYSRVVEILTGGKTRNLDAVLLRKESLFLWLPGDRVGKIDPKHSYSSCCLAPSFQQPGGRTICATCGSRRTHEDQDRICQ